MLHIGYGRVSNEEQAQDSNALNQQINRLLRAGVQEVYMDVQSGREDDRPDYERMMAKIRSLPNETVTLTITRDDRITRRGITSLQMLELFQFLGVRLNILDAGGVSDLSNPYAWKQRAQAGIDAEFESRMLSMRIKAGYDEFRRQKKANCKPPWGYVRVDERYKQDVSLGAAPRGCIDTFLEVRTLQGACRLCDERYGKRWSANGFRRWLLNPVLQGHTPYGLKSRRDCRYDPYENVVYNTHIEEAIMTSEEASLIRTILDENKSWWGTNRKARRYPLGGLMFCGECGTKCTVAHAANRVYVYCRQRKNRTLSHSCSQKHTPRMETIESAVIDALLSRAEAIATIAQIPDQHIDPPELHALKAEMAFYEKAPGNRAQGIVAELREQIEVFRYEQTLIGEQQAIGQELLMQGLGDRMFWLTLPDEEKRQVYKALVDQVTVKEGQVIEVRLKV
jgi:site-specific DNA recombinase